MVRPRSLLLLRLASLLAIGVSTALLIDSLRPQPAFCSTGSGCDEIRRLGFGKVAGVPVPALGLSAFGGLFSFTFFPSMRQITARAAIFGGVMGLVLLGVQAFVLHLFCKLCLIVDTSALVAAFAGYQLSNTHEEPRDPGRIAWLGALVAALGLPPAIVANQPPDPVPRAVRSVWKPGYVNIVEFSDFECPFCRMAHPILEEAIHKASDLKINLVRKTMPLPMHPNARLASHAYLCAVQAGKGPEMADRLFAGSLSKNAHSVDARELGIPTETFDACMENKDIEAEIDRHITFVRNSNFQGLPTVWINEKLILGARDGATYSEAIRAAAAGPAEQSGKAWPLALVGVLSLGLGLLGLRSAARERDEAPAA